MRKAKNVNSKYSISGWSLQGELDLVYPILIAIVDSPCIFKSTFQKASPFPPPTQPIDSARQARVYEALIRGSMRNDIIVFT